VLHLHLYRVGHRYPQSALRPSTRVSPGFSLFRHRSPSFGSQQICSYSNLSHRSVDSACLTTFLPQLQYSSLYFHYALEFSTQILAYMLNSLVRVTRRVDKDHFVRIANVHLSYSIHSNTIQQQNFVLLSYSITRDKDRKPCGVRYPA